MTRQEASDLMWKVSDHLLERLNKRTKQNPDYDYTKEELDEAFKSIITEVEFPKAEFLGRELVAKIYAMMAMDTDHVRGDWFDDCKVICGTAFTDGLTRWLDGILLNCLDKPTEKEQ